MGAGAIPHDPGWLYAPAKRALDIAVAGVGLLLLWPVLLVMAVATISVVRFKFPEKDSS